MPRPVPRFHDFIGQKPLVERLKRLLAGSQARREPLPHCLFRGMSGLGKTALTRALAAASGGKLVDARGQLSRYELAKKFAYVRTFDFFFIDEAHLLKSPAVDLLLEAIDDHKIIVPRKSTRSKDEKDAPEQIDIPLCTIVLATDQPGALANALIKRMPLDEPLTPYPIRELREIAELVAKQLNILISPQSAGLIAEVSHGLPRMAEQFLDKLRLWFPDSENQQLTVRQVHEFLRAFGVDRQGLREEHRSYLAYLKEIGTASLESLAVFLGTDSPFVRYQIEYPLMQQRLICIGKQGRQLSQSGLSFVETMDFSHLNGQENTNGRN